MIPSDHRYRLVLYARSRLVPQAFAFAVVGVVFGIAWNWWQRDSTSAQIVAQTLPAVLTGTAIGMTVSSPFGELDDGICDRPRSARWVVFWALFGAVALVYSLSLLFWERSDAAPMLIRGLMGSSGLTLITLRFVPVGFAWAPSLIWGLGSLFSRDFNQAFPWWAWLVRPAPDPLSWLIAGALLLAGGVMLRDLPFSPPEFD